MKLKPKTFFLIFILLLMIYSGWESLNFGHYEAMLAPLLLSICIFALGIVELIKELKSRDNKPEQAEDDDQPITVVATAQGSGEARRFGIALAWIGGFAIGIYLFGFFLSTLLFAVAYLRMRGRSWPMSAVFSVSFITVLYLVFQVGFKSQLYRGLIFGG